MKNITITLDEETATWARVYAAQRNMSLSRYVGEVLRERMRHSRASRQMTALVFVDANVLLCARDAGEPAKQSITST